MGRGRPGLVGPKMHFLNAEISIHLLVSFLHCVTSIIIFLTDRF